MVWLLVILLGTITGTVKASLLTDDFSDSNYTSNPTWVVDSGIFAADGSAIGNYYGSAGAGMLAFGTAAGTKIHLDFTSTDATAATIDFDIFQSNYAYPNGYRFTFEVADTTSGLSYTVTGYLQTGCFGDSGFNSYTSSGAIAAGTSGTCLLNGWQHVQIVFDPTTGVKMYYGGTLVSSFTNFKNLTKINRLSLTNESGTLSWFVDNVQITYVPEPMDLILLTENFSDNNYTSNPIWTVDSGTFAADGSAIGNYYGSAGAGMLAFGTAAGTKIHLDFASTNTIATTIDFDFFQSNCAYPSAYNFTFEVAETTSGLSYPIYGYLETGYYGTSGFNSYTSTGAYAAGTSGACLLNGWQHVKITFDPTTGVQMYYGGTLVSSFTNFKNLTKIDRLSLTNTGGTVSWFVDNVVITAASAEKPSGFEVTDDFSDNNYTDDPVWTVNSGSFATDGSSIGNYYGSHAGAGTLAFGVDASTEIQLDFLNNRLNYPVMIDFDLFQSNETCPTTAGFTFKFGLEDTFSSKSYTMTGSTYSGYFGDDDGYTSGFSSYTTSGSIARGEIDKTLQNGWQHVKIIFDPSDGVKVYYGGELVSSFTNWQSLTRMDRLILTNDSGTLSWFVDNVHVICGTFPPEFSPAGKYISGSASITILPEIEGSKIYYTTNGNDPTMASDQYTAAVSVTGGTTLKAIAVKDGYPISPITSVAYEDNPARVNLTRGHYLLIEKGLQIQSWAFLGSSFNLTNWNLSNFTTLNIVWNSYGDYSYLPAAPGIPWARLFTDAQDVLNYNETPFLSNLVSISLSDEQSLTTDTISSLADKITDLRTRYPDVIVYTNQYGGQETESTLQNFMQTAQPDMLMFDNYPFTGSLIGGSPTAFYGYLQKYRLLGLAGNSTSDPRPIPYAVYTQHYTDSDMTHVTSESELYLNEFSAWAFGYKFVSGFIYEGTSSTSVSSTLFDGAGDNSPTDQFYLVAEANRQSKNLGPALVRFLSTDVRMIMGQHTSSGTYNATPDNITPGISGANSYLTGVLVTNLGTCNNGLPGDVIVGFFKPLDESFDGDEYSNQVYFMVVNGLTDANGTGAQTRQTIRLTFNFGSNGVTSLQRLSRNTGKIEIVPLTSDGSGGYYLDLTLDGGTGDLFKYNTGAPFVGVTDTAIVGDLNGDSKVNATDIDLLYKAIKAGSGDSTYDLNFDGAVTTADMDYLVEDILDTYYGDADLNGSVGVSDLSVLAAYYNTASGASWANGDFDGNGAVGVSDLSILAANYNSGSASTVSWAEAYAQAFGTTSVDADETSDDATDNSESTSSSVCSSLGLSLIAGLAMFGLLIVKLEE
jgi:hypothetical protein